MVLITSRRSFLIGLVSALAAPAIVRADALMPVRVMLPTLPSYGWDDFIPNPNLDIAYQWCAKTVLGEPNPQFDQMLSAKWVPVPARRYADKFAISGPQIELGGCVLMERTRKAVEESIAANQAAPRRLVDQWMANQHAEGFEFAVRTSYGPMK
jgi:hypothetical protein